MHEDLNDVIASESVTSSGLWMSSHGMCFWDYSMYHHRASYNDRQSCVLPCL